MKIYVDDNEDYRITYSSRDGSECLESMGMQPIIVESLADHTKQVRKEVLDELCNMLADRAELIDFGGVAEFMFTTYDLQECSKELLNQTQGEKK